MGGCLLSLKTLKRGRPRALALAVVLAGILLGYVVQDGPSSRPAHAETVGSSIDFAENSTAPVAKFLAYDQDGDDIAWTLGGPDDDLFTIDDGVLAFREPPNYEAPQSATSGVSLSERNVYQVTVEAGGGTHDVAVRVTDVDEPGTASIDRRQPQVSRPLEASMSDEDEGVSGQTWRWARSEDKTTWTDIEGATSPRRSPEEADEGKYLRATVTYSDKFGPGKTASAVSFRRVEARTLSNAAPAFVDRRGDDVTLVTLSVRENTAVGRPIGRRVSATDEDEDLLFYELLDTPDLEDEDGVARFTIDSATGQIRVGKVLGADAGEREDEGPPPGTPMQPGDGGNSEYVLRVRASDPSTASATVNVIVTVTNDNEPPTFAKDVPTLLEVKENPQITSENPTGLPVITLEDGETRINASTFDVTDQDGPVASEPYSVEGDDAEYFEISDADGLTFLADNPTTQDVDESHTPNYEEKDSYSITITARSGGRSVSLDVIVDVDDTEDAGEVFLSQRQPQVGIEVNAIPSDPDGGMRIDRWVWEHSAPITVADDGTRSAECRADPEDPNIVVIGDWTPIAEASSPAYTPTSADVGRCLRATVVYTDNIENPPNADDEATGVSEAPVQESRFANAAPTFVDQDLNSPGDQSDRTSRRVPENTDAGVGIGTEVSAIDDDDGLLIYTLDGADASSFDISRNTGQLLTKASLNFEARNSYTVVVTATDPSGASDSIQVTVNVTNVHDPVFITGPTRISYAENGTAPVASYTAFDEAGHVIRWSLRGDDDDAFTIDGLTGQIRVGKVLGADDPDETDDDPGEREDEVWTTPTGAPELPGDSSDPEWPGAAGNSRYILRVRASDPSTASVTVNVIVTITEVNEPPAFPDDAPTLLTVVENEDPPVITVGHGGDPIDEPPAYAVTDPDGSADGPDPTAYTYSVSGADGDDFDIADGILAFKTDHEPDFEDQSSYSITIVARSGGEGRELSAALDVVIDVVDGEDPGAVVLSQRQPEVGIEILATPSDDDGGVTIRKWVWEWSDEITRTEGERECQDDPLTDWTPIAGADSAVYIPKAVDVGRCLRATAIYTDNIPNPRVAVDREVCVVSEIRDDEACGVSEVPVGRHGSFGAAPESDGGFVNAAPVFPDQDYTTEGDQSDSTIREVAEDTGDNPETGRSIGAPVSAIDDDDDLLIYTLTGPDAEFFRIGRRDGQLTTETPLNFEVRNTYSVVVTATDPFGAMDSIQVTIRVTDEDDPAEITVNAGASARGP